MRASRIPHDLIRSFFLIMIFFLIAGYQSYSQQLIKGKITDKKNSPLASATIQVRGTNNATVSDANGNFTINAKQGDILEISFIGYQNAQVTIKNQGELNISLDETVKTLDDVVLIGYGTSKRKDITGAVDRIPANEFNKGVITNPMQQLQGKVAGLVIVQPGGDPNGDFIVRLRGATSLEGQPPLIVIDGIAIDDFNKALSTLNPGDIDSYDILKDASSAAIYGARGANGVVLITTKKSRTGKTLLEYNGFTSVEKISNKLDVLTADEWRTATSSIGGSAIDKGANIDWQKAISRSAFSHNHLISLSGGADQLSFQGSLGYLKQEGVVINTGKEVISGRLSVNQKALKNKLEIKYGLNLSATKRDFLPDQGTTGQVRSSGSNIFSGTLQYLPVWPVYNPDGSYSIIPTNGSVNPVYFLKNIYSKQRENFFQGSVKADYEVIKNFKAGVQGAISKGNDVYDHFFPGIPTVFEVKDASKSNFNKQVFSGDIHLNYRKSFANQTIDLTGVYEYNKFVNDGFGVTARGFLLSDFLNNNLGTATNIQTNDIFSYKNEVKIISFLGRVVYNYNDRYLMTVNLRRDGSSKFGPNNRWSVFPSVAFAWRASNENFLKNIKWLNNLKLRISYGLTGNQENLPVNAYQLLYGPVGPYLYNGQFFQSYAVVQEDNPDLKWEVRKSFNAGIDFSILNNRLSGTLDVFRDKTDDLLYLYNLPQPPFLTDKVYANAADAVNNGVEISLDGTVIRNNNFKWSVAANVATLKNYITNLLGKFRGADLAIASRHYGFAEGGGLSNAYITELKEGYPAGVFWVPQHAGFDANGHELFNNYDSHGNIIGTSSSYSEQDRVFIDPTPDFTWAIGNNFIYKNFDLDFMLRGVQGQKIFANTLLNLESVVYLPGNNVIKKALTNGFADQPIPSDYWIRNGSFARLENLSLGYNFKNLKTIGPLRLYLSATNLFVITPYDGVDPEIKTDGSQRYIDRNYYPKTRGFTVGINVGF